MEKQILDEFVENFGLNKMQGNSVVSYYDLIGLKKRRISVEMLLDHLTTNFGSILHGSREEILENYLSPNEKGEIYGSKLAAISLMKAVISNRGLTPPGIKYPFFIDRKHPLRFEVYGAKEDSVGDKGFVYVINNNECFENNPHGSWQYVHIGGKVGLNARIEVQRNDLVYPVLDMDNSRRL